MDALFKDKAKISAVIANHVAAGKVRAADVQADEVKAVQASGFNIPTADGVMVDKAKVTAKSIVVENGVVHIMVSVVLTRYKLTLKFSFNF